MNHEILKRIIAEQHVVISHATIIQREYRFEENANYILTGMRRAGKSTLMYDRVQDLIQKGVKWNQIIYINFEDERLAEFRMEDFNDIVETAAELTTRTPYYFLDEIQNIEGWERFARRMADMKAHMYITGSNAIMLSRDMEARLGGRYLSQNIMPYNFREYVTARNISYNMALYTSSDIGKLRQSANDFMHEGGLPESLLYLDKRPYIEGIYQKVLLGDIAGRNGIRNEMGLRILMKKIAETVCSEMSYTKLYNTLKSIGLRMSKDTVISYIQYAKNAYLIFSVQNYFARFVEKESIQRFYFLDNGFLNLFVDDNNTALLENLVAITLLRMYAHPIYYLKSSKTGIDIDFFVPSTQTAIQVAWSIQNLDTRKREVDNLVKLAQHFHEAQSYYIITHEEEETIQVKGITIQVIPLYRFLLKKR